jgi:hypothetical protein
MKTKEIKIPAFTSESAEADWWASRAGRQFVKSKPAERESKGKASQGLPARDTIPRQQRQPHRLTILLIQLHRQ